MQRELSEFLFFTVSGYVKAQNQVRILWGLYLSSRRIIQAWHCLTLNPHCISGQILSHVLSIASFVAVFCLYLTNCFPRSCGNISLFIGGSTNLGDTRISHKFLMYMSLPLSLNQTSSSEQESRFWRCSFFNILSLWCAVVDTFVFPLVVLSSYPILWYIFVCMQHQYSLSLLYS